MGERVVFVSLFEDTHSIEFLYPKRPIKENFPDVSDYMKDIPLKYVSRFIETNRDENAEWLILSSNHKNIN